MENLTPITRKEMFLAKAAGQDVETPTPVTREEAFLDAIAKRGNGGGGVLVVNVTWDGDTGTLDKTWQQINDAAFAVMNVSKSQGDKGRAQVTSTDEAKHVVSVYDVQNGDYYEFSADSATGYPTGGIV